MAANVSQAIWRVFNQLVGYSTVLVVCLGICIFMGCSSGGGSSSDPPREIQVKATSISIEPSVIRFTTYGQAVQLSVKMNYNDGSQTDITMPEKGTTYMPSNPGIVSLTNGGTVKCMGIGDTVIRIANQGIHGSLPVKAEMAPASPHPGSLDALSAMKQDLGEHLGTDWNVKTGLPSSLLNPVGYLSGPSGSDASVVFEQFLASHEDFYQLSAAELDNFQVVGNYLSQNNGITHLALQQFYQGIPVHGAQLQANINTNGRIINIVGEYYPGIDMAIVPDITARAALIKATQSMAPNQSFDPVIVTGPDGVEQMTIFEKGPFYGEHTASLTILPVMTHFHLCWKVHLQKSAVEQYHLLVDALDGSVLSQVNAVVYDIDPPRGLVFERNPNAGPQVQKSFAGDPLASQAGWATEDCLSFLLERPTDGPWSTCGNNAIVGADILATTSAVSQEYFSLPTGDFSFKFQNAYRDSGGQDAATDMNAAMVNVFYWVNVMHDYYFHLGFDEAAGNFQLINFESGIEDWDQVFVMVHFGRDAEQGTFLDDRGWAAAFATTPDGMWGSAMFVNIGVTNGQPNDYAFDAGLIIHEYTHGVSSRLCGGAHIGSDSNLNSVQGGALSEGWSQWFPIHYLNNPLQSEYYDPPGMDINILSAFTFGDIGFGPEGPEVHLDGFIWTATLWDLREVFISRYGLEAGMRKVEQLVVDAMKLSPMEPTWLNMRDFILLADQENDASQNHDIIWQVFASRGMGYSATTSGPDDADPVEAFDRPPFMTAIEISNVNGHLSVLGATMQLEVLGILIDDSEIDLTPSASGTTYRSSNDDVVTVSAEGLVTAVAEGDAVITATNNGYQDTIDIVVTLGTASELLSIDITPDSLLFTSEGSTIQLAVIGRYPNDIEQDLTPATSGTTYTSSDTGIATVSADGLVTAMAVGAARITATNDIHSDTAIAVVAVPAKTMVFLGAADTADDARSLAIYGDYAYVAGLENITIIDITDPMQPLVKGTFSDSETNTYVTAHIVGGHLVIGFDWTGLQVYALDDPLAPQLVGGEDTGYNWTNAAFVQGNHIFYNTNIIGWTSQIVLVRGDLVAYDLSSPSNPVQSGILYNTPRTYHPEWPGSDYWVGKGQAATDQIALIPSTSGESAATDGTGQVISVDISDTSMMAPVNSLGIPGTKLLTGIACEDTRALAAGSTGAYYLDGAPMLAGNLMLTTLDISSPVAPTVIGSRSTGISANNSMYVTAGINQCYAISHTALAGESVAVLVDARDGVNPELLTQPVDLTLRDILLADHLMYAVDSAGLKIYDISGIVFTPHTCSFFDEAAPTLDAEANLEAEQAYSSLMYTPGPEASTDVSFQLHLNGTYIADVIEVLPDENGREVQLPNNLLQPGENVIGMKSPTCTPDFGSCEDGSISSWGGTVCIVDREVEERLWFERLELPFDIEFQVELESQAHILSVLPGPQLCADVIFDVYLNNALISENVALSVSNDFEPIQITTVIGENTIAFKNPECMPGNGCCPGDGNITSWAGLAHIAPDTE